MTLQTCSLVELGGYVGYFGSGEEAINHELDQVSMSGCGITAVLNVLALFNFPISDMGKVDLSGSILRKRANDASLSEYLRSRSVAGCTGIELVHSMNSIISQNAFITATIQGQFLPTPSLGSDSTSVADAIASKIRNGEVLIATLNLQLIGNDAWHHQLIYGIDPIRGLVHCMNPVGAYPLDLFYAMLSTPSVLLVRKEDVLRRINLPDPTLQVLCAEELWKPFEIEQQIERIGRDDALSHLLIPANYVGGIAAFKLGHNC